MLNVNMLAVGQCIPALPGFVLPKTYAAWPVWSGSTTTEVRFQPVPKKTAIRLWHRARDFDRQTRQAGKHGGALGHTALQVLHALIFDFLNYMSGRLDPSQAAIARKANVCVRSVATALKRLRERISPRLIRLIHVNTSFGISAMHLVQNFFASKIVQKLFRPSTAKREKDVAEDFVFPDYVTRSQAVAYSEFVEGAAPRPQKKSNFRTKSS